MTCCATLLADYFHGSRREKYFGLQVVFTTVAATIFSGVGGALGPANWRAPLWLYVFSLPLAVAAAKLIWQPAPALRKLHGPRRCRPCRGVSSPRRSACRWWVGWSSTC